jgi:hypothetical protein
MCIIAYKPLNVAFPEENILKNCFDNNDDGAGFMYTFGGEVHIHKGYETFEKFMTALNKARAITGDKVPYVMHFRIATQGYEKTMTHPFPLSGNMNSLKKLKSKCNVGVAHNGIIDLTSDGSKDYSDTMKFITDYLSLIIRGYDWYKDKRTCKLITKMISGSRLAILDKHGNCKLLGEGWEQDKGVYFSNHTWAYKRWSAKSSGHWNDMWWEDEDRYYHKWWEDYNAKYSKPAVKSSGTTVKKDKKDKKSTGSKVETKKLAAPGYQDPWGEYWSLIDGKYDFEDDYCPQTVDNDGTYCSSCRNCNFCYTRNMLSKRNESDEYRKVLMNEFTQTDAEIEAEKAIQNAKQAAQA